MLSSPINDSQADELLRRYQAFLSSSSIRLQEVALSHLHEVTLCISVDRFSSLFLPILARLLQTSFPPIRLLLISHLTWYGIVCKDDKNCRLYTYLSGNDFMNTFFPLFNTILEEKDSAYNEALVEVIVLLMDDHPTQVQPMFHTLLKWNSHHIRHYCISHYSSAIHSDDVIHSLFFQYSVHDYPWRVGLQSRLEILFIITYYVNAKDKSRLDMVVLYFSFIHILLNYHLNL